MAYIGACRLNAIVESIHQLPLSIICIRFCLVCDDSPYDSKARPKRLRIICHSLQFQCIPDFLCRDRIRLFMGSILSTFGKSRKAKFCNYYIINRIYFRSDRVFFVLASLATSGIFEPRTDVRKQNFLRDGPYKFCPRISLDSCR